MPYTSRHQESSTFFHVYSRGADRQDIYSLDGDHRLFEVLLAEIVDRFGIEAHAYALMSNHFHLVVGTPRGNLSDAMQFMLSQYGRAFNRRTNRSGPVFDNRFGSVPILGGDADTDGQHLYVAVRYVHKNPLAFISPAMLAAYAHSSLGVYLGRRPAPAWLTTELIAPMIDPDNYLSEVVSVDGADLVPQEGLPVLVRPSIEELVAGVEFAAQFLSVRAARVLVISLAVEARVGPISQIAAWFGVGEQAVRKAARTGRVRVIDDPAFAAARQHALANIASRRETSQMSLRRSA